MPAVSYHATMTATTAGPEPAPPTPTAPETARHALTYRPQHTDYEWLRHQAYQQHRSMQSIIDDAVTALRAAWADDTPEQP